MEKGIVAALAAGVMLGGVATAEARDLTVVGWGGASQDVLRQVYYEPFMKESGKALVEDSYNGGLAKIKAMVGSNSVTWDAILVEAPELVRGCEDGLFEPIDWGLMGGEAAFMDAAVSECGIGSYVWSIVIAYDGAAIADGPKNWADFWNVDRWPGKRGLRRGAKFNLELALMADGVPADQVYATLATAQGVDRAFAKLDQLKPHIQWWEAGAQPPEWLASGDVAMTTAYNGRISAANKEGKQFRIAWDGQLYAVDSWAIPTGSSNRDTAMEFIAFASRAEQQKLYPALMPYGVTNKEAIAAIPADIAANLPTSSANLAGALANNTEFWMDFEEELNEKFNAWAAK